MTPDCRHHAGFGRVRTWAFAAVLAMSVLAPPAALAQEGAHAAPAASQEGHAAEAPHGETPLQTVAKLANFAILVGVLVYFLKAPFVGYLASRDTQIRQALVNAAELRATATERLAAIQRELAALPGELEALRTQGAEDVRAEQARIKQAAKVERERLIDQTRREIETRLRIARRELTELGAQLAVQVAEQRIKRTITPDDQLRLVDRYTAQLREAR